MEIQIVVIQFLKPHQILDGVYLEECTVLKHVQRYITITTEPNITLANVAERLSLVGINTVPLNVRQTIEKNH